MFYPFLITWREGLEAALVLGIMLAYLARTGSRDMTRLVWAGALGAVLASVVVGLFVSAAASRLGNEGNMKVFEGSAMFLAAAVITHVVFWMKHHAAHIKGELQTRVDRAVSRGGRWALMAVPFLVVFREGLETSLFLMAGASSVPAGPYWLGAVLGLLAAAGCGILVFVGVAHLPLKSFFHASGLMLLVFAAGLIAHGIEEFHEVRLIPPVVADLWVVYGPLGEGSPLARLLKTLIGYDPSPSLAQVAGYVGYLVLALAFYLRRPAMAPAAGARRTSI